MNLETGSAVAVAVGWGVLVCLCVASAAGSVGVVVPTAQDISMAHAASMAGELCPIGGHSKTNILGTMGNAKPMRVVVAGCGGISNVWFKSINSQPEIEVVGLVDFMAAAAEKQRDVYGLAGAHIYGSLDAALRACAPDIVFDLTVPDAHADNVIIALEHGCHVLTEKPMAHTMPDARRALAAARLAGLQYAVMQNRRYSSGIRRMRALLNSGVLGTLTTVHVDFFIGAHFGGFRDHMVHVLLLDMAIHTFDAIRFVSGADATGVYCKEWNPQGSWYDRDASAVAIFEMTHGIVSTYRGSWSSEGKSTSWESQWRFIGTNGSAVWDGNDVIDAETIRPDPGPVFRHAYDVVIPSALAVLPADHAHDSCIRDFIACVQQGRCPLTSASDNIKSLAMVFAAIESADSGGHVTLVE